jgi:hypothetical protein
MGIPLITDHEELRKAVRAQLDLAAEGRGIFAKHPKLHWWMTSVKEQLPEDREKFIDGFAFLFSEWIDRITRQWRLYSPTKQDHYQRNLCLNEDGRFPM